MGTVGQLSEASQGILLDFVTSWELDPPTAEAFKQCDLSHPVNIGMTGAPGSYLAGGLLHYAAMLGDEALVRDMINAGAPLRQVDEAWTKKTPLQLACDHGRAGVVRLLLQQQGVYNDQLTLAHTGSLCTEPLVFAWGMLERHVRKHEVDYKGVRDAVETERQRCKQK